ncbi:MAG: S-methyl-5'-thioadenosine phosphorylase [Sphingomonadaceae bacterium]
MMLGVIGGSGLYALDGLEQARWLPVETPWGPPSDALLRGRLGGVELAFLPRHGRGHRLLPHQVNHRANIAALKGAGVTHLLAVYACGSLREQLPPGTFVLADQFLDRTHGRASSFFDAGILAHIALADPVSAVLTTLVEEAARATGAPVHRGGTYVVIDGPRFSTRAESRAFRLWGADVIGMTGMPEAALAREAELPLAALAMVTDFDAWRDDVAAVDTASVLQVLAANAERARVVVAEVARRLPDCPPCEPDILRALDQAILTPRDLWPPEAAARLKALAPRLFP